MSSLPIVCLTNSSELEEAGGAVVKPLIQMSDHAGLVRLTIDESGQWNVQLSSLALQAKDAAAVGSAVSEAVSLIYLDAPATETRVGIEQADERATSTFERILSAAKDLDIEETVLRQAQRRKARREGQVDAVAPPSPVEINRGPVTVVALNGRIFSVSVKSDAMNMTATRLAQALGEAMTAASRQSSEDSSRAQELRLHNQLRDTIQYKQGGQLK